MTKLVYRVYEPASARCIMKYFTRDRLPDLDVTIDRKMARFPATIATNRTIRNIICSFCTAKHTTLTQLHNLSLRKLCVCRSVCTYSLLDWL